MRKVMFAVVAALAFAAAASGTPGGAYTNSNGHEVNGPMHASHAPPGARARCRSWLRAADPLGRPAKQKGDPRGSPFS
jgi:hypothetical protein